MDSSTIAGLYRYGALAAIPGWRLDPESSFRQANLAEERR